MALMSLTKRLVGEGTGQDMEYEEELEHNVLAISQNAVISMAKKVDNSILRVITAWVVTSQSTMLWDPVANPPCTLLKVPNALVIKQVYIYLQASSRPQSYSLSPPKPEASYNTSHIFPSVLYHSRSCGVISLKSRLPKAR